MPQVPILVTDVVVRIEDILKIVQDDETVPGTQEAPEQKFVLVCKRCLLLQFGP